MIWPHAGPGAPHSLQAGDYQRNLWTVIKCLKMQPHYTAVGAQLIRGKIKKFLMCRHLPTQPPIAS